MALEALGSCLDALSGYLRLIEMGYKKKNSWSNFFFFFFFLGGAPILPLSGSTTVMYLIFIWIILLMYFHYIDYEFSHNSDFGCDCKIQWMLWYYHKLRLWETVSSKIAEYTVITKDILILRHSSCDYTASLVTYLIAHAHFLSNVTSNQKENQTPQNFLLSIATDNMYLIVNFP